MTNGAQASPVIAGGAAESVAVGLQSFVKLHFIGYALLDHGVGFGVTREIAADFL